MTRPLPEAASEPSAPTALAPPRIPRPHAVPRAPSPRIAALGAEIAADPRSASEAVERFWSGLGTTSPLAETDADGAPLLTFLWRSRAAASVLLFANRLFDASRIENSELARVPGTDVWHVTYVLDPRWRGSYGFLEHGGPGAAPWRREAGDRMALKRLLDTAAPDPRNTDRLIGRGGARLSVAAMPLAPAQPLAEDRAPAAEPDPRRSGERAGPDGRRCWLFGSGDPGDPARNAGDARDAGRARAPRPLWIVLDGNTWEERFALRSVFASMVASGAAPPFCAVLIDSGDEAERRATFTDDPRFVDVLADDYLPWARAEFGEPFEPAHCGVAGQSLGALVALRCGLDRPDAFGAVLSQSASLWLGEPPHAASDRLAAHRCRIRIEVGSYEWVLRAPHADFARRLREDGVEADLHEFIGGHDYACWRGGLPLGIAELTAEVISD